MSKKEASQFGKSLYKKLIGNQSQTEHLFEQIFIHNVENMEKKITDEEAQQRMCTNLVDYTVDISKHFSSSKEKEIAQGVIPYLMLEYVSEIDAESIGPDLQKNSKDQNDNNIPQNDFVQRFRANLERLKPYILENIAKHWKSVLGATALGATTYAVTKFLLGYTAQEAIWMGGGLALAAFIGWEVYEQFTKNK